MKKWMTHTIAVVAMTLTVQAQDYLSLITEEYLRSEFTFEEGEKLKYAKCAKRTPCNYVWSMPSKHDERNAKYRMIPQGKTVKVGYSKSTRGDLDYMISSNKDAIKVEGLGIGAIWSSKRKRLIVFSENYTMIAINLDTIKDGKEKEHAISVAKHILQQL